MKIISSEAGERFARAKREIDRLEDAPVNDRGGAHEAMVEYMNAADAVADELVAQGFGNAEGD